MTTIGPPRWNALMLELQEALAGRFVIEGKLGKGAMGMVFLAWERKLDRMVALKILPPDFATPRRRDRFVYEARAAARLNHQHIVPIYMVDQAGRFSYYTMRYIRGPTLHDRIEQQRGPLPPAEVARTLRQVASAVQYAHANGVIHRDLKPRNILISADDGNAFVSDFGIASVAAEPMPTTTGYTFGTCAYMSPERAMGSAGGERSDIYSLGIVGFEALTGRRPFDGTAPDVLLQQVQSPVPPVLVRQRPVDTRLSRVVQRCMAKMPAERFQTAAQLETALADVPEQEGRIAPPLEAFRQRVWSLARYSDALLLAGITGVGGISSWLAQVEWGPVAYAFGLVGLAVAAPFMAMLPVTRDAFAAGFTREDLVHVLEADLERQRKENAAAWGPGAGRPGHVARHVAKIGLAMFALGGLAAVSGLGLAEKLVLGTMVSGAVMAAVGGLVTVVREGRRRLVGSRWLRFWRSRLGAGAAELLGGRGGQGGQADAREAVPEVIHLAENRMKSLREFLAKPDDGATVTGEQRALASESLETLTDITTQLGPKNGTGLTPGELTRALEAAWAIFEAVDEVVAGRRQNG